MFTKVQAEIVTASKRTVKAKKAAEAQQIFEAARAEVERAAVERVEAARAEAEYRKTWKGCLHRGAQDIFNSICNHPYIAGGAILATAAAVIAITRPDVIFKNNLVSQMSEKLFSAAEVVINR